MYKRCQCNVLKQLRSFWLVRRRDIWQNLWKRHGRRVWFNQTLNKWRVEPWKCKNYN